MNVDLNREFKVTGLAGLVAALVCSPPGCHSFSYSLPSWLFRADARLTGIVASAVLAITLFFGGGILEVVPTAILGGLLFFISLDLLANSLINDCKRLDWVDCSIVLMVFVAIAFFGFITGIVVGLIVTVLFFTIRFSQVDVIRDEFDGRKRRSTKLRSIPDRLILMDQGKQVRVYRLQGYIFFGSAYRVVERMSQSLKEAPVPTCILLDLSAISGLDFSAAKSLCGFIIAADSVGTQVVLSATPQQIEKILRENLSIDIRDRLLFEPEIDHGLERCENMILAKNRTELQNAEDAHDHLLDRAAPDLEKFLDRQTYFEEIVDNLMPWLEPRAYETGESLAKLGETQEGLQFLVNGRASIYDSGKRLLYQCGPGDVVERRAAFFEHVASVSTIAQETCQTMMLTQINRLLIDSDEPELSLKLYRFLASYQRESLIGT